jgi:hypothetical protein
MPFAGFWPAGGRPRGCERLVYGAERRDVFGKLIGEYDLEQLRDAVECVRAG